MNVILGWVLVYITSTGQPMIQNNELGSSLYKTEYACVQDAIKSTDLGMPSQCLIIRGKR